MAVSSFLATLIVAFAVGLMPIPALAIGIGGGSAEITAPPLEILILTLTNDPVSDQDVLQIVLHGDTADNGTITWISEGSPIPPEGASSVITGQGTDTLTIDFSDVAGPSPGFNPAESFVLFGVVAEDAGGAPPVLADLIGVTVDFIFEAPPPSTQFSGEFQPDPGDPNKLTIVPEPRTAVLLVLGLVGLATSGRRRV